MRVVHYINQFFAGIGGEEKADIPLEMREGPVGPGRALQAALGPRGQVVATVICGDNYFHQNEEAASSEVTRLLPSLKPDVVVAGPAFDAGRYGLACARICETAQRQAGVAAVTAMYPENPGAQIYKSKVFVIPTADSALEMGDAIQRLADFACKLASGDPLGSAADEGYLPRGIRRNFETDTPAPERAVQMLLSKLGGEPFVTELHVEVLEGVPAPPPLANLGTATIAIVTEAGVVPRGNPDRIPSGRATKWAAYSIAGLDDLFGENYQTVHGGYDGRWVTQDPDRAVPVDALRELEANGVIGKLLDRYYVTCGNAGNLQVMQRMAREIAVELKAQGVTGVVVPAT